MDRFVFLFLLPISVGFAQVVSFGVKGGVPLLSPVDGYGQQTSAAKRYTVGPMVEVALPLSFAVEVDALYRRVGYDVAAGSIAGVTNFRVRANDWQLPIVAKMYILPRLSPVRLFVAGGYVLRYTNGIDVRLSGSTADLQTGQIKQFSFRANDVSPYVRNNPVHGVAVGGGARLKVGRLSVAPEVRYTHWGGVTFDQNSPYGFSLQSRQNQVDVLVGLTF